MRLMHGLWIVALNAMRFRAKAIKHKDTLYGEGQSERTEAVISALPEPSVSNSLNVGLWIVALNVKRFRAKATKHKEQLRARGEAKPCKSSDKL